MSDFEAGKYSRQNPYLGKNTLSLIDARAFDALVRDQGCKVSYEPATFCPCYYGRIDSGQKNPNCKKCENGYITYDNFEIFVYIASTETDKKFRDIGVWDLGTARMYTPSYLEDKKTHFYIGEFDKITVLDLLEPYYEVINRGTGDTDFLMFRAWDVDVLRTEKDVYLQDIDFKLDDNGNIKWVSTHQPSYDQVRDVGEAFTIRYKRNPVYRVVHIFEENRFGLSGVRSKDKNPVRLVQEAMIKKDYLITKQNSNGESRGGVDQG